MYDQLKDDRPYLSNSNKEIYCSNCKKKARYIVDVNYCTTIAGGQPIHFYKFEAYCEECHKRLDVPEVHDRTEIEKLKAFSKQISSRRKSTETLDDKIVQEWKMSWEIN